MSLDAKCYSCGSLLDVASGPIGRGDSCDSCRADVRCCKNCKHYDTSAYNECHEPMAERVVDKERANFCDYFSLVGGDGSKDTSKEDALKKLDDLFK